MHGVHRAKHVRMLHTEANGSIAANENAGYSSGISVSQGCVIGVDVWNYVLGYEVFPISGGRGIDVPGRAQRRIHIGHYQDEFPNDSRGYRLIKKLLGAPVLEIIPIS